MQQRASITYQLSSFRILNDKHQLYSMLNLIQVEQGSLGGRSKMLLRYIRHLLPSSIYFHEFHIIIPMYT